MPEAFITPDVLRWARERARFTPDGAAQKIQVRPERLIGWEAGEKHPTFRQARQLAKVFHVPFGYFFLPSPPREELAIPDLRTVGGRERGSFSLEFIDAYHDVLRKQEWFREYRLKENAAPLPFIGKYSIDSDHKEVANNIRQALSIDYELRASARSWELYLSSLIEQAEAVGILVMRNSIVGNNTHRHLSVEEFRGFAISDSLAPLIFLNSADAKSAQVFSLTHELVHLWVGQSGVSNPELAKKKSVNHNQGVEVFCNRTAAEVLVPEEEILVGWDEGLATEENLARLSKKFRVSQLVVARRCYDLDILGYEEFREFYLDALRYDRRAKQKLSARDGGPGAYAMQRLRNGKLFSQAVSSAAFEGSLSLRDAGALLGMRPGKLKKYAEFLAGR